MVEGVSAARSTEGPVSRFGWTAATIAVPMAAYLLVMRPLMRGLTPRFDGEDPSRIDTAAQFDLMLWAPGDPLAPAFAADFAARVTFAVSSALLFCGALAALVWATAAIRRRAGDAVAATVLAGAALGGIAAMVSDQTAALRHFAARSLLTEIADRGYPHFGAGFDEPPRLADAVVLINSGVGVAAIGTLAAVFAAIAARPRAGPSGDNVALRIEGFRAALLIGAAILALSVAATHAYYAWPLAFMPADTPWAKVVSAAMTWWGAVFTTVLIGVAAPTLIALDRDARALARAAKPDEPGRRAWRKERGLVVAPTQAVGGLLAALAPLLTAPALDLLGSVAGMAP